MLALRSVKSAMAYNKKMEIRSMWKRHENNSSENRDESENKDTNKRAHRRAHRYWYHDGDSNSDAPGDTHTHHHRHKHRRIHKHIASDSSDSDHTRAKRRHKHGSRSHSRSHDHSHFHDNICRRSTRRVDSLSFSKLVDISPTKGGVEKLSDGSPSRPPLSLTQQASPVPEADKDTGVVDVSDTSAPSCRIISSGSSSRSSGIQPKADRLLLSPSDKLWTKQREDRAVVAIEKLNAQMKKAEFEKEDKRDSM
eukprot:Filipodium_phascolosomae@DN1772_c0_g1_i2.p1